MVRVAPAAGGALAALLLLPARAASAEVLEGWPCPGCITVTPEPGAAPRSAPDGPPEGPPAAEASSAAGREAGPRPLLVALHGDGGGVRALVRAWKAAANAAGVILVAPLCPRAKGCTSGSWWQWYDTAGHDPAWLGAQIDAVEARFPVDPRRVFATGYSGGATYLGWYAPEHAARFAAVAHVAGGAAYRPACPACKVPVLFVLGAADPMLVPYTRPLRDWYAACGGHEISWETLPGVTHEGILPVLEAGRARQILSWLLARPAACLEAAPPDAGAAPPAQPAPEPAPTVPPAPQSPPGPAILTPAAPPPRVPPAGGCACTLPAPGSAPGMAPALAVLASLAVTRARRRPRPRRARPAGRTRASS